MLREPASHWPGFVGCLPRRPVPGPRCRPEFKIPPPQKTSQTAFRYPGLRHHMHGSSGEYPVDPGILCYTIPGISNSQAEPTRPDLSCFVVLSRAVAEVVCKEVAGTMLGTPTGHARSAGTTRPLCTLKLLATEIERVPNGYEGGGGGENKRLNNSGFRSLGRASGAGFGPGVGAGAVRWFFSNTEQSNSVVCSRTGLKHVA